MKYVIKASGKKEKFNFSKIVRTCIRAGVPKNDAIKIARKVEEKSYSGITTKEVLDMILAALEERRAGYASKYDLKGAIMRLGPSGFPFEKLIAGMFERLGYSGVKTGNIIQGRCVPHEVDVVAERDGKRCMIECKYKNFPGIYIGLQKALYVWARFEDLQAGHRMKKCRRFDVPYLICNTKFSEQAIQYASCIGLKLMGWNYPENNSISDILTKNKIYPVTVLRGVNTRTLQLLSDANMLLCDDLSEKKLIKIGISRRKSQDIMNEVKGVLANNG